MEESWNFAPIVIPLIALLAGWAIGFFDSNMRTNKKIKQAEDSAQIAITNAERKLAEAQTKLASVSGTPVTVDDPGLMRIKNEKGRLTLDLDGVRVNTSAISSDQRKRLVEMLNAMRPWLEGKSAPAPTPVSPPQPRPVPATNIRPDTPEPIPHPSPPPTPPVMQQQASASKPMAPAKKKKDDDEEAGPKSIVGQINQILQARIVDTPLEAKGVSLMESVTGGVNVYVGVKRYEAIDDVPDEEIKAEIRAAIAAWEEKYTPGMK